MPRRNNRAPQQVLPTIAVDFGADAHALWAVTMTNGSGTKLVEVPGTKSGAFAWAQRAGATGGIAPGRWWPVSITCAANVISQEPFLVVA